MLGYKDPGCVVVSTMFYLLSTLQADDVGVSDGPGICVDLDIWEGWVSYYVWIDGHIFVARQQIFPFYISLIFHHALH